MLPRIAAAVPLSLCCCCACQCRSCLAAAVHGALASLLLCRSCVAAAVPLSPRCCRTAPAWLLLHVALSHRPCCGTLDRTAAAVALSHHCCCAALAWLLHAVHGALASLLPCLSRLAAAAAFSSSPLAAAVHGALASLLPCDSHLASWCCGALVSLLQGALASLLPCPSRIAAAVRNLHRRYRAALAWLLLWHSRTAAAASVALLHRCCCGALTSLPPCGSCIPKCPSSSGYGFLDRCEAAYTQAGWLDVACGSVCGDHL